MSLRRWQIVPVFALTGILLPGFTHAQPCAPVEPRNPHGNYIVPGTLGGIVYSRDLALDAYVHPDGLGRASAVVIHGGGWRSGSRVAHVGQLLELLAAAGYNWFSVDYRLAGLARHEESLEDIRAALAFVRCRAADLGVDASRLILVGEESGAHLAALLAAERPTGVIGAVLIGGFYDLARVKIDGQPAPGGISARASPLRRTSGRLPRLLVVHGGADNEAPVAQAREYCAAVESAGSRCRFLEVPGASHRLENWWPSQWGYKRELVSWLADLSAPPPPANGPSSGPLLKNIVYSSSLGLTLDAFVPPSTRPRPAVVIVHGGGWEAGDKVTYVTPLFEPLAKAGVAWFSIDYRLTPDHTHEDQLEDVRQAIRFVRSEHARFNVDPSRIFLLGESASGQMAAQIASEDRTLAGIISFYGVYDFPSMVSDASPRSLLVRLFRRRTLDDESRAVLRKYSPLYSAHKSMPPFLLVNGTGERLWAQAQMFAERLRELGVRHEVIALEDAPHGLENWEGHPEWLGYKRQLVDWIYRVSGMSRSR